MTYLDKNNKEFKIGDFICIKCKQYLEVKYLPSIGVGVDTSEIIGENKLLDLDCLKKNHRKVGNTQGRVPLVFLELSCIERCLRKDHPEFCI